MFCALLTSRYQVSVYRTNGPLVFEVMTSNSSVLVTHCSSFELRKSVRSLNQRTIGPVNAHLIS